MPLHVSNGSSATRLIDASGIGGDTLPWDDPLHEGPVPGALDAARLREVRARFLAGRGWTTYEEAVGRLGARDGLLEATVEAGDRIVLWFESDLYDQLQLLQVLDRIDGRADTELLLMGDEDGFVGIGELSVDEVRGAYANRRPLRPQETDAAKRAWAAVRSADPRAAEAAAVDHGLAYVADALVRLLEQLPWTRDGLSRTERALLRAVADGAENATDVFVAQSHKEERPFLGDAIAFAVLEDLRSGDAPLLEERHGRLAVTALGHSVLRGDVDAVELRGIDRWVGGVHVTTAAAWRWDGENGRVVPPRDAA